MRWLITGGCGFIGTRLIAELRANRDNKIRVIDNLSVGTRDDLSRVCIFDEVPINETYDLTTAKNVHLVVGDILNEALAIEVTRDIDVVVHLAANTGVGPSVENPRVDCMLNVVGTFNYLEAAKINKVNKFIFASSGAPAGEVDPPIHEELPPRPVSPYGASKLAGEGYCSAYYRTYGVNTVMLRFGNVYGPGSGHKNSVVAKFIKHALNNEPLKIYGDGLQTRDFIYISDLIQAILLSVKMQGIGGEIFQIASNKETTVAEMADSLVNVLNMNTYKNITIVKEEQRLGDVRRNYSDTTKAREKLGWIPKVPLSQGLEMTVASFLQDKV